MYLPVGDVPMDVSSETVLFSQFEPNAKFLNLLKSPLKG